MSREQAGSYTPSVDHALGRRSVESGIERSPQERQIMPQARIARQFMLGDIDKWDQWNEFVDHFAQKNTGTATTNSVGMLAVTYFQAKSLSKAMTEKYPSVFAGTRPDRARALAIYRSLSQDYNSFVEGNIQAICEDLVCKDSQLYTQAELDAGTNPIAWLENNFAVNQGLLPIQNSKSRIGVRFSQFADERLRQEMKATRVFLRSEGLLVASSGNEYPHMTLAQTFHPTELVAIKNTDVSQPKSVPLDKPKMLVFDHKSPS